MSGRRLAALALCAGLALACRDPLGELTPLPLGGELELAGVGGETFRFADHAGEIKLVFFGYASCPEVCPTTLARVARVQSLLGDDAARTLAVFVSVDPERDTPERLVDYVRFFGVRGVGVTGTPERVAEVARAYGASYERVEGGTAAQYLVDHTTWIYLVDRRGRVRRLIGSDDPPERIAGWVRKLLEEPAG